MAGAPTLALLLLGQLLATQQRSGGTGEHGTRGIWRLPLVQLGWGSVSLWSPVEQRSQGISSPFAPCS